MAPDNSWIEPATKNLANLFGLNPEARAKGALMQKEGDYYDARIANTNADTGLSDYRRRHLEAQAAAQNALGGKYTADATFTGSKTKAQEIKNQSIARLFEAGSSAMKNIVGADGKTYSVVDNDQLLNTVNPVDLQIALGNSATDAERALTTNQARRNITSGDPEKVRTGTILSGQASAAGNPNFAANNQIAQGYRAEDNAAKMDRTIAGRAAGSAGSSIAKNIAGGGAVGQAELNRQSEAIKEGAAFAKSINFNGVQLDDGQAAMLAQAARAENPSLNPQDAIIKFTRDHPGIIKKGGWFSSNEVNIPVTLPQQGAPGIAGAFAQPQEQAPQVPQYQVGQGMPMYRQQATAPQAAAQQPQQGAVPQGYQAAPGVTISQNQNGGLNFTDKTGTTVPFDPGAMVASKLQHGQPTRLKSKDGTQDLGIAYWNAETGKYQSEPIGGGQSNYEDISKQFDRFGQRGMPSFFPRSAKEESQGVILQRAAQLGLVDQASVAAAQKNGTLDNLVYSLEGPIKQLYAKAALQDPRIGDYAQGKWDDKGLPDNAMELADRMGIDRKAYGIPEGLNAAGGGDLGNLYNSFIQNVPGSMFFPGYGGTQDAMMGGLKKYYQDVQAGRAVNKK